MIAFPVQPSLVSFLLVICIWNYYLTHCSKGVIKTFIPKKVTARRPLLKEEHIDYDYDSSQEWEDEIGESLSESDLGSDETEDEEEASDGVISFGRQSSKYLLSSFRRMTGLCLQEISLKENE